MEGFGAANPVVWIQVPLSPYPFLYAHSFQNSLNLTYTPLKTRLQASADLIVSFNASGLPEDLAADAYVTELGMEVVEASGAVRQVTLGVSASVATEAVASSSSWGAMPPGRSCAEADLGEYAAQQVRGELWQ